MIEVINLLRHNGLALISTFAAFMLFGCAASRDAPQASDYNRFAIRTAQAELWNEAVFRWKQVIDIDPSNSKAYNNLGVAYEALGKTDEAVAAYQRAAELEPDNKYYRLNYRRCRIHIRRSGVKEEAPQLDVSDNPSEESAD